MLGRKPVMAQEKLDIEALGARDAGLLGLEQGDLVLLLECVSYDASGQAIEYVKSFNRGDTAATPIRTSWGLCIARGNSRSGLGNLTDCIYNLTWLKIDRSPKGIN